MFMRGENVIKGSRVINIFCLIGSFHDTDANGEGWWEEGWRGFGFRGSRLGNLEREFFIFCFVEGSEGGF